VHCLLHTWCELPHDWQLEIGLNGKLLQPPELLPTVLPVCKLAAAAARELASLQATAAAAAAASSSSSSRSWRTDISGNELVQGVLAVAELVGSSIQRNIHERYPNSFKASALKVAASQ
jgi:hypothetical protein